MDEPKAIEYRFARYSVDLDSLRKKEVEMRKADAELWNDITDADLAGAVDVSNERMEGERRWLTSEKRRGRSRTPSETRRGRRTRGI
jgi:hypothetical protein